MAVCGGSETRGAAAMPPRGNTYTVFGEYARSIVGRQNTRSRTGYAFKNALTSVGPNSFF
jgi:hypothetical protein